MLPRATTWSNGNVFRSLTLLAVKWCEAQGLPAFDAAKALTPANLQVHRVYVGPRVCSGRPGMIVAPV